MRIGLIGAGAFGTALANSFATAGQEVLLWGRDKTIVDAINHAHTNPSYLSGVTLSKRLYAVAELEALSSCSVIICATPAQTTREIVALLSWASSKEIVLTAKGIERGTGALQSEIVAEAMPRASAAVLSGPSFASEIAAGKPTALTLGVMDQARGRVLQEQLSSERLRLYLSNDPIGVQLGGALKNVIAIAAGIISGAGFGESARAAVITRGYSEMSRLALALGAEAETLTGLSGFGDLVLTATSEQSRNYSFGLDVGRAGGLRPSQTVEGFSTASATAELCLQNNVEMPIARAVADILSGKASVAKCVAELMKRPLNNE